MNIIKGQSPYNMGIALFTNGDNMGNPPT